MNEEFVCDIMKKFGGLRIGVLGDFALDAYWMLVEGVGEISVETGKPAFVVRSQRYTLGGAGNITANLAALKPAGIEAFGVVGDDLFGRQLVEKLEALGVDSSGMIRQGEKWDTAVWGKPYLGDEELRRFDYGFYNELERDTCESLFSRLNERLPALDALVVNQQLPRPLVNSSFIERLNELVASFKDKLILVDCRRNITEFRSAVLKFNEVSLIEKYRGVESLGPGELVDRKEIGEALENLFSDYGNPIIITRGRRGCLLYDKGRLEEIPGVLVTGPIDPVGAGDTMTAALVVALAAGVNIKEAALLANFAASVTVKKLKETGTASQAEIMARVAEGSLIHRIDLAEDPRQARFLDSTRIEIVNPDFIRGRIKQVLFDHDGTVSTLRQGWEPIMEEVMLESILGTAYSEIPLAQFQKIQGRVKEFIDQTTGVQTLVQMQGLADMVREFGFIPQNEILDAKGYKAIFNVKLLRMVNKRLDRLEDKELDVEDFTVKGAIKFLKTLQKLGLRLYLASGTDEEDVKKEAGRLGYASFFEGGIFGSVGDITKDSKRKIIAQIITDFHLEGPQLCTFGDGPVEIRETKKRGGIAVGVSSDEVRRHGMNLKKRERLIKAGADIIVEDFTQGEKLLKYLTGKD